jgi:hypothetical protein
VEIKMLRWMSRMTKEDRIRSKYVTVSIDVAALIVYKMRENRLRWFGHKMRQNKTKTVIVVIKLNVEGKRGRERPKKRRLDTIENDMRQVVCA